MKSMLAFIFGVVFLPTFLEANNTTQVEGILVIIKIYADLKFLEANANNKDKATAKAFEIVEEAEKLWQHPSITPKACLKVDGDITFVNDSYTPNFYDGDIG